MSVILNDELRRVAAAVRAIVLDPALRPSMAPPALAAAALAYPQAGGKALRPALLVLANRALGGAEAPAVRAGTAVELYHTYTLVHDDIIDRDPIRRGHPSAHALMTKAGEDDFHLAPDEAAHYGLSMGILAGDVLHAWSLSLLATLSDLGVAPGVTLQLIRRMETVTGPAIVEGEALDIQLPFLPVGEVTPAMMLRVICTKTAALFAYCAWAGGLLARGGEDDDVRALTAFAEDAGISFQLQDDVLGLIGDEAKLGKPVGNDLREGKRTSIIALAWERASAGEQERLSRVLGNTRATPAAVAEATALLQRLGAIDEVQARAGWYLEQALGHLDRLPATAGAALLKELAAMMVQREK